MSSNKKHKNSKIETFSPSELLHQANQVLETGRFRDAIECFKALLKIQNIPEYQLGLAAAYAGRAKELYAKGMIKESIAIWDNRHQFCPQAPIDLDNAKILLQHGYVIKALQLFYKHKSQLNPQQINNFHTQLAVVYLSGVNEIATELPPDDPILTHSTAIKTALEAYCQDNDTVANSALATIPFRSPYRDLVQIIKALLKFNEDRNVTTTLLKKIPSDSPFLPVLKAVELAIASESEFNTAADGNIKVSTFEFAATLRGWSTNRIQLWQEIKSLGNKITIPVIEKFMYKYESLFGKEWVRQKSLRLFTNDSSKNVGSPIFAKNKLTALEKSLLSAWDANLKKDSPFMVITAWNKVIDNLRDGSKLIPGSNDSLRIALIQRKVEKELNLLNRDDSFFSFATEFSDLSEEGKAMLEESLTLDPEDLPTYVRLITYYRNNKNLKDARRLLNIALERWPDEPSLLMEAMDIAKSSGSFKKATMFAKRLLEQDSINSRVKDSLLDLHLSHFHKQVSNGSFTLAKKELAIAETCARDERAHLKLEVASKFLVLKQQWTDGITALQEFLKSSNPDPNKNIHLSKQFAIILEAMYMEIAIEDLIKILALPKIVSTNVQDFLLFLRLLRELLDQNSKTPTTFILERFIPAIKHAKDLKLSQEDCEILCATLQRCNLKGLHRLHAGAALERWPGLPIFEWHYFTSKYGNSNKVPDVAEVERLETAEARALEIGDTRVANKIRQFLDDLPLNSSTFFDPKPDDLNEANLLNEMQKALKEIGIEGLIEKLKQDPIMEEQINQLESALGPEKLHEAIKLIFSGKDPNDDESSWLQDLFFANKPKKPRKTPRPRGRWVF